MIAEGQKRLLRVEFTHAEEVLDFRTRTAQPTSELLSADQLGQPEEVRRVLASEPFLRAERLEDGVAALGLTYQKMVVQRRNEMHPIGELQPEVGLTQEEHSHRMLVLVRSEGGPCLASLMLMATAPTRIRSYRLCGVGSGGAGMLLQGVNELMERLASRRGQTMTLYGSTRTYGLLAAAQVGLDAGQDLEELVALARRRDRVALESRLGRLGNTDSSVALLHRFQNRRVVGKPFWNRGLANWLCQRDYPGDPPQGAVYAHLQALAECCPI